MKHILAVLFLFLFLSGCTPTPEIPSGTTPTTMLDHTIHFTVVDNTLICSNGSNGQIVGYTNAVYDTLAERITETKEKIGVIPTAIYYIDLTFTDTPPESITLINQDRYGTEPETTISNPASTVTLQPKKPMGYFLHSSLQYEWYFRIICSYPDRNVEYVLVLEHSDAKP